MTPVRPGWSRWLRTFFWAARHIEVLIKPVRRLGFIQFAHWTLIKEIPYNGPPQEPENLRHHHLLFESNFNGGLVDYVESFLEALPHHMRAVWASSYGAGTGLKLVPPSQFIGVITGSSWRVNHYYCAYPEAAASTVEAATELRRRLVPFMERGAGMSPEQLEREYRELLSDVGRYL
jgi:hypothetical protein